MYSTCLFCNTNLGTNEAIEAFPVGRRLAFDARKGRLWVVCRRCERWNLTPLEERWEAIEECERAFRETRLRVSTDEIGLARLREGLELVRIGAPQRPEMAAWRYGDQFGRRRRNALLMGGAAAVAVAGYAVAGPILGIIGGSSMAFNLLNMGHALYRSKHVVARIPVQSGANLDVTQPLAQKTALIWGRRDNRWMIEVTHRAAAGQATSFRGQATTILQGDDAVRAARLLLPTLNARGAGRRTVGEAVTQLEEAGGAAQLFDAATRKWTDGTPVSYDLQQRRVLHKLPVTVRLALEMAANEETERRALEGELHLLESAWRDAEEIAGIADDLLLPASMDEELARLRTRGQP